MLKLRAGSSLVSGLIVAIGWAVIAGCSGGAPGPAGTVTTSPTAPVGPTSGVQLTNLEPATIPVVLGGSTSQSGAPPLPASFYGVLSIDGADVPAGTVVAASIGGMTYAARTGVSIDGRTGYAIDVPADDAGTPEIEGGREGDRVVFSVGDRRLDPTTVWHGGTNRRIDLNGTRASRPAGGR